MDSLGPNPRHKKSHQDMSHSATLSPSPIHFGNAHSNFFGTAAGYLNFERRRTPHPHNSQSQGAPEEMPDRSQSQLRPRLEHRASQTVIDLTDEPEDVPIPQPPRAQRPPQLGRSDAVNLGDMGAFIDLTGDGDAEIMITGERRIAVPRRSRAARIHPRRVEAHSPPLFVPNAPPPLVHGRLQNAQAEGQREAAMLDRLGEIGGGMLAVVHANMPQLHGLHIFGHFPLGHNPQQAMPGLMNYGAAVPNTRPDHVAPPAARKGFTRSPTEEDAVICPSCEKELVHDKESEEPVAKRSGKASSRRDREEHPFWVVKECGHVYCNSCYQALQTKKHAKTAFKEVTKKSWHCAVDECATEVNKKDKWVGVFL